MYFANITAWSQKADNLFTEAGSSEMQFDIFEVVEHHLLPLRLGLARRMLGRGGFATVAAPARQGLAGGTIGGVMVAASKRLLWKSETG